MTLGQYSPDRCGALCPPLPESGAGSLSPDGTEFVYTPIDRDFRSWKRYRGGRAQDTDGKEIIPA